MILKNNERKITDKTLVAFELFVAISRPEEKDLMIKRLESKQNKIKINFSNFYSEYLFFEIRAA